MKILVIHATAGAGHKKAAEAIFNGLRAKPGYDARLVDALDYTNPFFKKIYPAAYALLVTRLPLVWGVFFAVLDLPFLQLLVRLLRRLYNGCNARALEQFLKEEQFDCIIATQFLSAEVCAYLKRAGQIKSKVICVVTDFDVHRIWVNRGTDAYTVACDYTKAKLARLGVAKANIFVTGIPTDPKFAASVDVNALKERLGLRAGLFTVLIATGSFGMGPIEELIQSLKRYQLIIICGHNRKLYERLKPLAKGEVHVFGLVHHMDELMSVADVMVTKPGGLSIAEALVKRLPMIFFSAIPGQETHNIQALKAYGIADGQASVARIVSRVDDLSASPQALNSLRARLAVLSKPTAVHDIVALTRDE